MAKPCCKLLLSADKAALHVGQANAVSVPDVSMARPMQIKKSFLIGRRIKSCSLGNRDVDPVKHKVNHDACDRNV